MTIRRWVLRNYYLPTGEVISELRFVFRWSAQATWAWHRVLVRRNPDFALCLERL